MISPLILSLPLLLSAGLLMLAPASLALAARHQSAVTLLAILLLSFTFSLLMIRFQSGTDIVNTSRIVATTLVMLAAGLIAAPLLDRTRVGGLVLATTAAGILMVPLFLHGLLSKLPPLSGVAMLYAVLIVSVLVGLGGSMQLPMSNARFTSTGARRMLAVNSPLIAIGWVVFAIALAVISWTTLPPDHAFNALTLLVSGISASFLQLMFTRADEAISKAGEGFAAGIIIALMGVFTLETGLVAGLIAGFFVLRTESISTSLRIDDAPHFTGVILIPSLLGMLAPALLGAADIGAVIHWIGVCGALGVGITLTLWPLIKLTVGLATR
jgi:hypothetical protein